MAKLITAVLLSGGISSRFWPLLDKNTFVFQGKEFLYWHYLQLIRAGIDTCIVVTNDSTNNSIRSVVVPEGLRVSYVIQKGQGMGQAVAALDGLLLDEPILILNTSDYYSDNFITSFVQKIQGENTMILGAVRLSNYFPGGYLRFNIDKTVAEVIEKPPKGKEPSDIGRIVADFYPKAGTIIDAVKLVGDDQVNGYEKAMNLVIANGLSCKAEITEFLNWCPMKYPWHILTCMQQFFPTKQEQHIHPSVEIKKNVVIEGSVIIEEGVKIIH